MSSNPDAIKRPLDWMITVGNIGGGKKDMPTEGIVCESCLKEQDLVNIYTLNFGRGGKSIIICKKCLKELQNEIKRKIAFEAEN